MAQGRTDVASAAIGRVVGATTDPLQRTRLLPAYIEIMLTVGNIEDARNACRELANIAESFDTGALGAMAAHAQGAVELAEGDARSSLGSLRRAFEAWQQVEAPYEAARVRVLAGLACRALGDDEGAALELDAARTVFEELGAAPDLSRINSLTKDMPTGPLHGSTPSNPMSSPPGAEDALPLPDKPSIAVLPFNNMSGDAEQEYFSDGITEDIITELSRFSSLFVIARNSSFTFKGEAVNVTEIGEKLGVAYVVEGSVRKAGNRVRITAQLVEAATGNHVWAERYDRDLEDIFAVQDEVVREIATAVPGQLDVAALQRVQRRPIENLTAYDLVLRAEHLQYRDWSSREATTLFEKAVELDPQCARAYSHLANAQAYSIFAHFAPADEARRLTRDFAERAIQFDPNDPVILATIAEAYLMVGDLEPARRCMEKAIKLNPNDYVVMLYAAQVLAYTNDVDEGLRWLEKQVRHDPRSIDAARETLLEVNYLARRYDDAIDGMRGWHDPPTHLLIDLAAAYAQLGRIDEAQAMRRQAENGRCPGRC